jgi:hypothetical protein
VSSYTPLEREPTIDRFKGLINLLGLKAHSLASSMSPKVFTFIPAVLEKLDTQPGPPAEMELEELHVSKSLILAEYTRFILKSYESQHNVISKEPKLIT